MVVDTYLGNVASRCRNIVLTPITNNTNKVRRQNLRLRTMPFKNLAVDSRFG